MPSITPITVKVPIPKDSKLPVGWSGRIEFDASVSAVKNGMATVSLSSFYPKGGGQTDFGSLSDEMDGSASAEVAPPDEVVVE